MIYSQHDYHLKITHPFLERVKEKKNNNKNIATLETAF